MQNVIVLILLYFTTIFIAATIKKNNSIVDIFWGMGFVLISWYLTLTGDGIYLPQLLLTLMTTIWGLRLSYHIFKRNHGREEDFRYAAMRKSWGRWVIPRAYLQIFLLQGVFLGAVGLPQTLLGLETERHPIPVVFLLGMLVFGSGFIYEAVADRQLKQFVSDKMNKGRIMDSGLWRHTRHPNYFGEAVLWWGFGLTSFGAGAPAFVFIGPLVITLLLRYVSGVPLLEKSMKKKVGFDAYASTTPIFVPRFARKPH